MLRVEFTGQFIYKQKNFMGKAFRPLENKVKVDAFFRLDKAENGSNEYDEVESTVE